MPDFPLLGEGLAVDLANTRVRHRDVVVDLLAEPGAGARWLQAHAGALPAGRVPDAALRELRDAVAELVAAAAERRPPRAPALRVVDDAAGRVQAALRASADGPVVAWRGPRAGGALVLGVIASAAQALFADPAAPVRACANPDCVLHFVARDARRRFCTTAICANRVRQARHRARRVGSARERGR